MIYPTSERARWSRGFTLTSLQDQPLGAVAGAAPIAMLNASHGLLSPMLNGKPAVIPLQACRNRVANAQWQALEVVAQ
jgi:hypothetical protein